MNWELRHSSDHGIKLPSIIAEEGDSVTPAIVLLIKSNKWRVILHSVTTSAAMKHYELAKYCTAV